MDFTNLFINKFLPELSKTSRKVFKSNLQLKKFKKGDIVVKQGSISFDFLIVKSGIMRSFMRDEKGKEYTRTLYMPVTTSGDLTSLITRKPTAAIYDCLTDCEVLVGDFLIFIEQTKQYPDISLLYNRVLESIFIRTEKRVYDLSVLNATERYVKLKKEIPNINNLIPQYHIASYLNISPVQLSRIRKELYSK